MGLTYIRDVGAVTPKYALDANPTTYAWGSENAALYSILFRTDVPSIYYKSGNLPTSWTLCGGAPSALSGTAGQVPYYDLVTGLLTGDTAVASIQNQGYAVKSLVADNISASAAYPTIGVGGGTAVFSQSVYIGGPLLLHNSVSPVILPVGNTNDWGAAGEFGAKPYGFSRIRATSNGGALLTGIEVNADAWPYNGGNVDGLFVFLQHVGAANTITLKEASGASIPQNRFALPNGADVVLNPKSNALLMYEYSLQRWIKI